MKPTAEFKYFPDGRPAGPAGYVHLGGDLIVEELGAGQHRVSIDGVDMVAAGDGDTSVVTAALMLGRIVGRSGEIIVAPTEAEAERGTYRTRIVLHREEFDGENWRPIE